MTALIFAVVGALTIGAALIALVCLAHRPRRVRRDEVGMPANPLLDRTYPRW